MFTVKAFEKHSEIIETGIETELEAQTRFLELVKQPGVDAAYIYRNGPFPGEDELIRSWSDSYLDYAMYQDEEEDEDDWRVDDDGYESDDFDPEHLCDCGGDANDACTLCGNPMCHACFEMSGGVCDHHGRG